MKNRIFLVVLMLSPLLVPGQFQEKSAEYQKFEGYFDFYYDDSEGKVYLEVDKLETEFLYVYSLSSGIGSNDIGLDRGQLGNEQVVFFRKAGNKLLLIQPNLEYRAITDNELERKSVEQAFARSVLFGFPIVETIGERHIVELTPFLMQDMHGVSDRLKRTNQGSYSLDTSKSAVNLERTRAFPENIELDVLLTFKGDPKGNYIRSVAPNPKLVTVAQHHSMIKLPDPGFEKRAFDPRSGVYPFSYYDYATPVEQPIVKRYIPRHRLEKKDPSAERSEAVEPIVYYLDNGTPEPVRSALLEGGRWWNQAFEAIGYTNAFQVKMLPDDADPLDVRYNVIQWVHRSTRGWSYGSSVADPRTGEIIKGHVSLGSLRIRQDFMIAQALTDGPFANSDENTSPMLELALARIRQLSAHEIGHTLGFAHNFAASTNNRASVMDYPHPYVRLDNGKIDFSQAYDTGIGEWDKVTVAYAYSDFPEGTDEQEALSELLREAEANGLRYISDQDARPAGGAHAYAHLWDNGANASEELERVLRVRRKAMEQFSPANIRTGEPLSVLEDVFVPLYFFHRYQTEAVSKLIGGLDYNYAVRGQESAAWSPVDARQQEAALEALLRTLEPEELAIPQNILQWFPPRAMGYRAGRESFKGRTGPSFDALGAAETSADMTLGFLLHPQRASRLVHQHALDSSLPGLEDVLEPLLDTAFETRTSGDYQKSIREVVGFRTLEHLMALAKNPGVHPQVNGIAQGALDAIRGQMLRAGDSDMAREIVRRIDRFREHPELVKVPDAPKIPDGSPIGSGCTDEIPVSWK
ncbi:MULTISPECIES: zinc-dependent metalloprotease [unclassified Robiginitalea]|uniref:zinc-dependent metalloprotease n=1 Tax=Robiginitalea TaxID=252306 RepID=UPI00234B6427|nr:MULTISPECIES: zinc-dependent metalloprotease [unclassified Robiginitalea]MDC6354188.1 zinc-dependent metalloprotease [Robiginitalea sp. PM2]MDC6374455.1 zinc-dependent metalloprotease [Robiginitalea sp. SP8]